MSLPRQAHIPTTTEMDATIQSLVGKRIEKALIKYDWLDDVSAIELTTDDGSWVAITLRSGR